MRAGRAFVAGVAATLRRGQQAAARPTARHDVPLLLLNHVFVDAILGALDGITGSWGSLQRGAAVVLAREASGR